MKKLAKLKVEQQLGLKWTTEAQELFDPGRPRLSEVCSLYGIYWNFENGYEGSLQKEPNLSQKVLP